MTDNYEPKVIAFCCHYCTYSAADLAGSMRLEYAPNVRVVKLMCTGKVDVPLLLKAFEDGADAVMVGGCRPGDCHYVSGNYKARRRMAMLKTIFETLGLDANRIWTRWISASEGPEFAEAVKEITEETKKQGPSLLATNWAL